MTSMDGLKRRIAEGKYTVDAREVAGAIVDKLGIIKRTQREMQRAEEAPATEAAHASKRRGGRGASPAKPSGRRTANGRS
jgi:hypothetical protein